MRCVYLNMARKATDSWGASCLRAAAAVLLVSVSYYVGANIGFLLRFPPATPSIMWPPNAILTATLLLTPSRQWWICLLAAFPAHLIAELGVIGPLPLVLALFITNCSEACLAASGVRWLSDAPIRFDTLRRVVVFIVAAVLLAPFVTSFADAAAVAMLKGEPYWLVWRTRLFSNALTELTLVPALVMVLTAGPVWLRGASRSRYVEAALLAGALCVVGIAIFAGPVEGLEAIPYSSRTLLVLLLPLFLWAAVRFGPGGASLSLLATAFLAMWAASHGRGPFAGLPSAESALILQIFLTVITVPLMCLAALIEERQRADLEAQRSRQELAHFTRVSTIGELTASLAHELSQPLTGILTNAQAAHRFLEVTPPAFDEFRDILFDIVEDVKRASNFIQRLRDLLRKNESQYTLLDLSALSRDVVKLVHSDAVIRNVTVILDLDSQPSLVHGDPVQLQQVVLNLLLNAMEAMAECVEGDRTVTVRTRNIESQTVQASVQDTGPGLREGTQEVIFEPFYTTKSAGMGMGLSISRSIIEAHGGVIWVANHPTRGATFHFTLPWAGGESP
jgi:signal transduction histidine kinase